MNNNSNDNNDNREFVDLREGAEEQQNISGSQSPTPAHYPPSPRKKNKTSFAILAAILVIAGLLGGSSLVISSVRSVHGTSFNLSSNGSLIPDGGINTGTGITLDINLISNSVVLRTHSRSDIVITYTPPSTGSYTHPHYEFNQGNSVLRIIEERRNNWFGVNNFQRGVLTVNIPENTDGVFESLSVSATSGRVEIFGDDGRKLANNVSLTVTSGGVFAFDFAADRVNLGATSGGVTLRGVEATSGNITAHSTSGGVTANRLNASGDISLTATSGGIRADGVSADGNLSVGSTSGGVRASGVFAAGDLSANVTSGGVTLENSEILGNVTARATSGGITFTNVSFDQNRASLSTTSGRITVNGERLDR